MSKTVLINLADYMGTIDGDLHLPSVSKHLIKKNFLKKYDLTNDEYKQITGTNYPLYPTVKGSMALPSSDLPQYEDGDDDNDTIDKILALHKMGITLNNITQRVKSNHVFVKRIIKTHDKLKASGEGKRKNILAEQEAYVDSIAYGV